MAGKEEDVTIVKEVNNQYQTYLLIMTICVDMLCNLVWFFDFFIEIKFF